MGSVMSVGIRGSVIFASALGFMVSIVQGQAILLINLQRAIENVGVAQVQKVLIYSNVGIIGAMLVMLVGFYKLTKDLKRKKERDGREP